VTASPEYRRSEYAGWPEPPATPRRRNRAMPAGLAVTAIATALAATAVAAVIAGSPPAASPSPASGSSTASTADILVEGPVPAIELPWETFPITSVSGVSLASGSRHTKRDFAYEMVAPPTDLPRFVQQTRMQSSSRHLTRRDIPDSSGGREAADGPGADG
jgi:hypothetical protein